MTDRPAGPGKSQAILGEVRRRIVDHEWRQGDRIPDEADLATEFGAARATVNKALQILAEEGLLDRRRRGGTRVVVNPVRKATFAIPIIREQIEQAGLAYSHRLFARDRRPPPAEIAGRLGLPETAPLLHLRTVHYGDGRAFQLEDRWINPAAVPAAEAVDFHHVNANEWLVRNAPYVRGELTFSAANADVREARLLGTRPRQALLILNRTTWNDLGAITTVRVACRPGHVVHAAT